MRLALLKRAVKVAANKGGHLDADCLLQHVQDMENDRLELAEALRRLVAADNCNYSIRAMRHEGLFKQAERLLGQLGLDESPADAQPTHPDVAQAQP